MLHGSGAGASGAVDHANPSSPFQQGVLQASQEFRVPAAGLAAMAWAEPDCNRPDVPLGRLYAAQWDIGPVLFRVRYADDKPECDGMTSLWQQCRRTVPEAAQLVTGRRAGQEMLHGN